MIAFNSSEGRELRNLKLSRPAILALWSSALECNQMDWANWARDEPNSENDPNRIALQFLHAAALGQKDQMCVIGAVLKSLPTHTHSLRYVCEAINLQKMIASV